MVKSVRNSNKKQEMQREVSKGVWHLQMKKKMNAYKGWSFSMIIEPKMTTITKWRVESLSITGYSDHYKIQSLSITGPKTSTDAGRNCLLLQGRRYVKLQDRSFPWSQESKFWWLKKISFGRRPYEQANLMEGGLGQKFRLSHCDLNLLKEELLTRFSPR